MIRQRWPRIIGLSVLRARWFTLGNNHRTYYTARDVHFRENYVIKKEEDEKKTRKICDWTRCMTAVGKRKQEIVLNFPHSLTRSSITQFLMYTSTLLLRRLNSKGPATTVGWALCLFLGQPTRFRRTDNKYTRAPYTHIYNIYPSRTRHSPITWKIINFCSAFRTPVTGELFNPPEFDNDRPPLITCNYLRFSIVKRFSRVYCNRDR